MERRDGPSWLRVVRDDDDDVITVDMSINVHVYGYHLSFDHFLHWVILEGISGSLCW